MGTVIKLQRKDLIKQKENCKIEDINLQSFRRTSLSYTDSLKAHAIIFTDNDGKVLILKDRVDEFKLSGSL